MPLFDAYVFVDWSSANSLGPNKPTRDAIWIGEHTPSEHYTNETYCPSRQYCINMVSEILLSHIRKRYKVLVGFDFPYGYPKGFAKSLGHDGPGSWWKIWEELSHRIHDTDRNINNRFNVASDLNAIIGGTLHGPFWGHPVSKNWPNLWPKSPGFPFLTNTEISLGRLRKVDGILSGVQEAWKLYGAGSVGSQALVGIPRLYYLRNHEYLSRHSKVWPFETGFTRAPVPTRPFILHAEIWPGVVKNETIALKKKRPDLILDQAQVRAMCQWAAKLDQQNELCELFGVPQDMDAAAEKYCIEEEGWILGAR